jgi:hypothetical protein
MNKNNDYLEISLLYTENAKVAAIFWEWRHKVITRFFTALTAIFFVAAWFYERPLLRVWTFSPFLLGAIFSMLSFFMDRVNTHVLRGCYQIGNDLEIKITPEGGIFKSISEIHYGKFAYYSILNIMYIGCAIMLVLVSIFASIFIK